MSINYSIVYNDGHETSRKDDACFGKLKNFSGNVAWEKFAEPDDHDGVKGARYIPHIRCNQEAAVAYWEYLLSKPLWASAVLEAKEPADSFEDRTGVLVTFDVSPTHMLNTLSIFRHVEMFGDGVDLFKKLIDGGCEPDMAFICSGLLRLFSEDIELRTEEDSEHTVLAHGSFSLSDYTNYVGKWQVTPPKNRADCGKTYREIGKYVRGNIATWLCAKGRSTKEKDLLQSRLLPSTYNVVYDTEKKVVERCSAESASVNIESLDVIVTRLNELHALLVS